MGQYVRKGKTIHNKEDGSSKDYPSVNAAKRESRSLDGGTATQKGRSKRSMLRLGGPDCVVEAPFVRPKNVNKLAALQVKKKKRRKLKIRKESANV